MSLCDLDLTFDLTVVTLIWAISLCSVVEGVNAW